MDKAEGTSRTWKIKALQVKLHHNADQKLGLLMVEAKFGGEVHHMHARSGTRNAINAIDAIEHMQYLL